MKRGFVFSKPLLAGALVALGLASATFVLHRGLARRESARHLADEEAEAKLAAAIAGLRPFGDPDLASLRTRVTRFRNGLGAPDTWARAVRLFGSSWNAEPGSRMEKAAYSIQPGAFYLAKPSVADWPSIIDAVGSAEGLLGVEVVAVEMRSSGDRERRALDLVKVAVAVHSRLEPNLP